MTENKYERLKIVMTEYEILRREAEERVKYQLQLYSITLTAVSLIFGYVIVNQRYEALLLLPFITIMLAYRWIWDVKMVDAKRKYLLQIEEKTIPRLMKAISKDEKENDYPILVGWQRYYEEWREQQAKDWLISAFLLFGIPTALSIAYYFWFLNNSVFHITLCDLRKIPLLFQFPNILYFMAIIIYGLASILILIRGYRLLKEREKR